MGSTRTVAALLAWLLSVVRAPMGVVATVGTATASGWGCGGPDTSTR